jgi:hypothetical protein
MDGLRTLSTILKVRLLPSAVAFHQSEEAAFFTGAGDVSVSCTSVEEVVQLAGREITVRSPIRALVNPGVGS